MTRTPDAVRREVMFRDISCVGPKVGMPLDCIGRATLDHVRASGGLGLKSRSTPDNLVVLCVLHHEAKTLSGRFWRPPLLAYLESVTA